MDESKSRRDTMREIEQKHFGQCFDQIWSDGRRTLIERMELRDTPGLFAVVVKQFESRVPSSSSKPWPELSGCWVYVPVEDGDSTWTGLDEKLAAFRDANKIAA